MDKPHISGKAVILTAGTLHTINAKTAHGLLRVSNRFEIIGVIDDVNAGKDAGEVVDNKPNGVPVLPSILSFIEQHEKPKYAIIGMATKGGILPKELYPMVKQILSLGIHIVNGLHQPISEIEEFESVAYEYGDIIYDIRKSRPFDELHFWTGKVQEITAKKIAVLGTDCALGKRTTSKMLESELNKRGKKAEMIYTGQTGWMQGANYGFLFDATANDFISGELEHAMYECWKNENVEVLIMEGQSGLRNPSGPCGSEFIISGAADGVILQHSPVRVRFKGFDHYPAKMPDIMDEVELIEKLGAPVIGITINTQNMTEAELEPYRSKLATRTDLPIVFPFFESIAPIVDAVVNLDTAKV